MSGMPISAFDSNVELVALVLEVVGGFCWLVGIPAMVAGRSGRWARSRLVDVVMVVSFVGIVTALIGAGLAGQWAVLIVTAVAMAVTTVSLQLVREQRPDRPDQRRLLRSMSGLVARVGWYLARDRETYTAAVVRVERPAGAGAPRYSLPEIRQELVVGQILTEAELDECLNQILDEIAEEIAATVHGVARIDADPGSARYRMATYAKISDFANCVLAEATEPDAHRTVRPYGRYSATMLNLAAACRLADRSLAAPVRV